MSTRRKLMMASWATPSEAQVFGIITVNAEALTAYLAKVWGSARSQQQRAAGASELPRAQSMDHSNAMRRCCTC